MKKTEKLIHKLILEEKDKRFQKILLQIQECFDKEAIENWNKELKKNNSPKEWTNRQI